MVMSPSGRKAKGKKYEEKIANILHKMFMEQYEPYKTLFEQVDNEELRPKRDFASGNMNGSHGDINLNLLKPYFGFSMECKHWASLDLSLNSIIKESIKSITDVYENQAEPKAKECGLRPLVVFSANRTKQFAMLHNKYDGHKHESIVNQCITFKIPFVAVKGYFILEFQEFVNLHIRNLTKS